VGAPSLANFGLNETFAERAVQRYERDDQYRSTYTETRLIERDGREGPAVGRSPFSFRLRTMQTLLGTAMRRIATCDGRNVVNAIAGAV
jgi:hypothetical protein